MKYELEATLYDRPLRSSPDLFDASGPGVRQCNRREYKPNTIPRYYALCFSWMAVVAIATWTIVYHAVLPYPPWLAGWLDSQHHRTMPVSIEYRHHEGIRMINYQPYWRRQVDAFRANLLHCWTPVKDILELLRMKMSFPYVLKGFTLIENKITLLWMLLNVATEKIVLTSINLYM